VGVGLQNMTIVEETGASDEDRDNDFERGSGIGRGKSTPSQGNDLAGGVDGDGLLAHSLGDHTPEKVRPV